MRGCEGGDKLMMYGFLSERFDSRFISQLGIMTRLGLRHDDQGMELD